MYQDELFREHFWQPKNEASNNDEVSRENPWQVKMKANSMSQHSNREKEENKAAGKANVKAVYTLKDKKEANARIVSDDDDEDEDDEDRDKTQKSHNMRNSKRMRKFDDGSLKNFGFYNSEKIHRRRCRNISELPRFKSTESESETNCAREKTNFLQRSS